MSLVAVPWPNSTTAGPSPGHANVRELSGTHEVGRILTELLRGLHRSRARAE